MTFCYHWVLKGYKFTIIKGNCLKFQQVSLGLTVIPCGSFRHSISSTFPAIIQKLSTLKPSLSTPSRLRYKSPLLHTHRIKLKHKNTKSLKETKTQKKSHQETFQLRASQSFFKLTTETKVIFSDK